MLNFHWNIPFTCIFIMYFHCLHFRILLERNVKADNTVVNYNLYYSGIASAGHLIDSFCYLVVVLLSAQEVLEVSKNQSLILN